MVRVLSDNLTIFGPLARVASWLLMLLMLLMALGTAAAAVEVEAQLDRQAVPAGSGALMSLRISGARAGEPVIPEVDHLMIQPQGRSQQLQMVNGVTTVSVIYQYAVGSHTAGDYQIPPITVVVDGKSYATRPLTLKVLDAAAAQPPAGIPPASGTPGTPPDGAGEETGAKRFGFLTVEPATSERKFVYLGEIAPVRIQAWIPADARAQLRGAIQPEGKAFTLHHVSDQPQQRHEIKDGKRYLVVTWYGGISAAKAGKFPASLSVDATVAVRDPAAARPRRRGGLFDDPLFGSLFDDMHAPMIQKDVTLQSDDREIEVHPLPVSGRPEGFSGAVGNFEIDAWEVPTHWQTGEPQRIAARLKGKGNFALANAPALSPPAAWKTYPGKNEFMPGDATSFSGAKSFEFNAVPRNNGPQEVALTFSYFDPDTGSYQTLKSPAQPIQVAGEEIAEDVLAAGSAAAPPPEPPPGERLVGQNTAMSRPGELVPLVERPAFPWLLGGAAALGLLAIPLGWWRLRRSNPRRLAAAAVARAMREALQSAARCAATRDAGGFFAAARLALQQRLGAMWNQTPQAITLAEVLGRLPAGSPVAGFFREADLHAYSRPAAGEVLPEWQRLLDAALAELTPPSSPTRRK